MIVPNFKERKFTWLHGEERLQRHIGVVRKT